MIGRRRRRAAVQGRVEAFLQQLSPTPSALPPDSRDGFVPTLIVRVPWASAAGVAGLAADAALPVSSQGRYQFNVDASPVCFVQVDASVEPRTLASHVADAAVVADRAIAGGAPPYPVFGSLRSALGHAEFAPEALGLVVQEAYRGPFGRESPDREMLAGLLLGNAGVDLSAKGLSEQVAHVSQLLMRALMVTPELVEVARALDRDRVVVARPSAGRDQGRDEQRDQGRG